MTESSMADAVAFLHREHHQVAEGSAATGVAALREKALDVRGRKVGVVVSGGNIDEAKLLRILQKEPF